MGENNFAEIPVAVYAVLLFLCGMAYYILLNTIKKINSLDNQLADALKKQSKKGFLSAIAYLLAIPAAFIHPVISAALFLLVAIVWWWPDKNIEQMVNENN